MKFTPEAFKPALVAALSGVLLAASSAAQAGAVTDCPLRDAPFSAQSPLIDILLSDQARSVAEKELGIHFDGAAGSFLGVQPPTFSAIVTLKEASAMGGKLDPEALARADAALRKVAVTSADKAARCARYDNDRPQFTLPQGKPRLLLFEKINGFKDTPSVDAARSAFLDLARQNGWAIVVTDKGGAFTSEILHQFDAVIWNNVSGDVLTLSQRAAFKTFLETGGAFIGVHGSGGDPAYFWDWYADNLLGARFAGHPMAPQFQDARIAMVAAPDSPLAAGLPREWTMNDEWYSFHSNPRAAGAQVIATLDEKTYSPARPGESLAMGDHPIAWSKCMGRGRMFYSAIGHRPETYADAHYRTLLTNAVTWAAQRSACVPK